MSAKARITADFATPSEVAERLRIPASRAAELRRQMIDLQFTPTVKGDEDSIVIHEFKAPRQAATGKKAKQATIGGASRAKKK
jgi:hypothetical protein